jgi:hypothetical protein
MRNNTWNTHQTSSASQVLVEKTGSFPLEIASFFFESLSIRSRLIGLVSRGRVKRDTLIDDGLSIGGIPLLILATQEIQYVSKSGGICPVKL